MLVLLVFLTVLHFVFSIPVSDFSLRSIESLDVRSGTRENAVRHVVTPIDPANDAQIDDVETHLKRRFGEHKVSRGQDDNELVWSFYAKRDDVQDLTAYEGIKSVHESKKPKRRRWQPRTENEQQRFSAIVKEPKSRDDSKELTDFIRSKVPEGSRFVTHTDMSDNVIGYGGLPVSQDVADEIAKHEDIRRIAPSGRIKKMRSIPKRDSQQDQHESQRRSQRLHLNSTQAFQKRTVDWRKQSDLSESKHLVVASQWKDADINQMSDYVFGSNAGSGVYIYVIEEGIQLNARNKMDDDDEGFLEFRHCEYLPTDEVRDSPADNLDDGDPDSHGTLVASAALGLQFGIAKDATLVSVKWWGDLPESVDGIKAAAQDIFDKGRESVSVVVYANGDKDPSDPNEVLDPESDGWKPEAANAQKALDSLLEAGVPFIVGAGNDRGVDGRDNVDFWPAHFSSDNYPIIVVGEVDIDRKRSETSQGGDRVTTWAMTENTQLLHADDSVEAETGTSYGAGVVAGLIATWMTSDQPSWDKSLGGLDRAKAIRKFLKEGELSGWKNEGTEEERVAWNGATQQDHDGATPSGELEQAHNERLYCNDLADNKFGRKVTFEQNIADFCRNLATSTSLEDSITEIYNPDQLQRVELAYLYSIDENSPNEPETEEHCRNKFGRILQECDLDDQNEHGYRYSAGGEVRLVREGTSMQINVQNERYPWVPQPAAHCRLSGNNPSSVDWEVNIEIAGRGWEGTGLESKIKGAFGDKVKEGSVNFHWRPDQNWEWAFTAEVDQQFAQADKSTVEEIIKQEVDYQGLGADCALDSLTLDD